ncbi:hypothetical protein [Streptomyces aurantiogriseus]|uniref:Uncharacterized protein n=1 Tax=Streptomyces aurantiogriseus TaxID=66870 RepID=A0A918KVV0_9ACTN|nr:hypothetical protein [Streptomyces aurantiogriseus]GGR35826.1 hypothetical protein GCM10010251_60340 [Streptomyces aurantiogriseus]
MPRAHQKTYADSLTDSIGRQLSDLTEYLAQPGLSPEATMRALARVLDPEEGILGRFTGLMATGSVFAKTQAEHGALPAEVWLALGRAANELHDIGLDLDEHAGALTELSTRPTTTAKPPTAAPLVVRRRR